MSLHNGIRGQHHLYSLFPPELHCKILYLKGFRNIDLWHNFFQKKKWTLRKNNFSARNCSIPSTSQDSSVQSRNVRISSSPGTVVDKIIGNKSFNT
ncbi:hypothetical protein L3Y34_013399 [Caenorhabditis briggsae]|uniref:Uncharacterized protein n=1 Tax=Caenorhabditis briggsae TaxID=6238 RepID=A0AAE8ZU98_CAEBR|nr:hypothetical protein L3Y34_013399 [Caenorhabditis briggsae]